MSKLFYLITLFLSVSGLSGQVNTESYRLQSDSSGFSIVAELELLLMAGNTDFQHFGSNSRINYNWTADDNTFIIMNGGYGRENGKTFFSQALFHLRNVNQLNGNLLLETFIQYDNNKSLLLLNRYLAGAGVRYSVLGGDDISSRIGASVFGEREEYNLEKTDQHEKISKKIRFSSYFTLKYALKEGLTLMSVSYLQPEIKNPQDFRLLSNNALIIKLAENISLNIKADVRYDSKPAQSIKKYDLSSKIAFVVDFI